jgi:uncharacterized protein with HEPN domain
VKGERVYHGHIRDAINHIEEYASVGRETFIAERMAGCRHSQARDHRPSRQAALRCHEDRRSEIPWKQIAGMRDRLTQDYFGVDLVLVWRVIERDLPALKATVVGVL